VDHHDELEASYTWECQSVLTSLTRVLTSCFTPDNSKHTSSPPGSEKSACWIGETFSLQKFGLLCFESLQEKQQFESSKFPLDPLLLFFEFDEL
jgi:hypothetical protein